MAVTIEGIEESNHVEYTGDVKVIGNIGDHAKITIKDGNLIVEGSIGRHVEINFKRSTKIISSKWGIVQVSESDTTHLLHIYGDVGDNVRIKSHSADIRIEGYVGNHCDFKNHNGNITVKNMGQASSLVSHNGTITCENVADNVSLVAHNGSVCAMRMGEHGRAVSHNGDVRVQEAPKSVHLETHNGTVYENGVRRKKARRQGVSQINIFSGSRVFINEMIPSSDASVYIASGDSSSLASISMMVLGGFIMVAGIAAVALAIVVVAAATVSVAGGLAIAGGGCVGILAGLGIFALGNHSYPETTAEHCDSSSMDIIFT